MRSFIKRVMLLTAISLTILISGCFPLSENNMLEEISPVIFWSVQEAQEGKYEITTLAPPLVKEEKRLLTLNVDLLNQARKGFNLIYYREMRMGQLRMVFLDEKISKKGVKTLFENLLTDPEITERIFVAIIKGDFKNFMQNQLVKNKNLDYFLYRMFNHYEEDVKGGLTIVNLHEFMKNLYSPLSDPILPVFKISKDNLIYDGTAFFKNDKFIGNVNKLNDHILQLMDDDRYLKLLPIPDLYVTLGNVDSNVVWQLNQNESSLSVKVNLNGNISEYRGNLNLKDPRQFISFQNEIGSYLDSETTKLMNKMQQWKVDPMNIGTHTMHPFKKPMSEEEWREKWETIKINVDYQINLQTLTHM